MSLQSAFGQLAALRDDAQLLLEQAAEQEEQLEALVSVAEEDLQRAQAAISDRAVRVIAYTGNPSFEDSPS